MSIQNEITRINNAKNVLVNWLTSPNVDAETNANLTRIAEIINSLTVGVGEDELKTINGESLVGAGDISIPLPAYNGAEHNVGYATNWISEVFTDLNNLRMLAQGEYNFVIDSTTANAPTGVATTTAICIKTYRTRSALADTTLVPTLYIRQDLFMANRHFYRMISHPNQSSFTIDDITFGNWIEVLEKLDAIYPIGSVYVSNTNSNPSEVFGGTWELIDKQFKSSYLSTDDTWFKPSGSNNTQSSNSYTRDGHSVRVRIVTKTAKSLTDTDVALGNIDLEKLGMQSILGTLNVICYINDDALGIVAITFNTGELTWRGLIGEATNVASDASITIDAILETSSAYMLDEACDKFYWKRTA